MRKRTDELEQLQQIAPEKLTIGQRIRIIRGDQTQTEFGKLLNKSQDAISVYETDAVTPPLDILSELAEIGNVTIGWLAYGPSTGSHKDDVVFHGYIIKPESPEWHILEMVTNRSSEKMKEKIVEMVNSYISIEKK